MQSPLAENRDGVILERKFSHTQKCYSSFTSVKNDILTF